MKRVYISNEDFEIFRECRLKDRKDWWATFTAEPNHGSIYPFVTRGYTHLQDRHDLRLDFPKLAEIADIYLDLRPTGGRFFINAQGVFFHETWRGPDEQFVQFAIEPLAVPAYKPPA